MLLHYVTPDLYIQDFRSLKPELLRQKGIRLLLCDIDNTLAAHDESHPSNEVQEFISRIKLAGIQPVLISNNSKQRVETFARDMKVPYYGFAKKPLKRTYRQCIRDFNMKPEETAVLGDQLLTDIMGGSRMKLMTILADPLVTRDITWTKFNRVLEKKVYDRLAKKGILKQGEYHEH